MDHSIDFIQSLFLGVIEGVTEFLPVSSTAHLRIAQQLMHQPLDDPFWKMYAVVIQLGAVLCLPIYFGPQLMKYIRTFPKGHSGAASVTRHPITLVGMAFVCTALPILVLTHFKIISKNLENLHVIGAALLIGGAIMWAVDALCTRPNTDHVDLMTPPQAIWIGLVQVLSAAFPGTSRSMSTIAAGQTSGLSRATALEFSFLLSIPTMFAATLKELLDALLHKGEFAPTIDPISKLVISTNRIDWNIHKWLVLAIGFVVSFIVAFIVVAWFMSWVRRRGFVPFAIYRIIVGIAVLLWARHLATRAF